ncbi:ArdC-like ssDNA-binding domain-containing protein [Aporhodopirellula aestuarii]
MRSDITDQIINALESGNLPPWRKPWNTTSGSHLNMTSCVVSASCRPGN